MLGLRTALLSLLACAGLFVTPASGDTLYAVFGNTFGTLDPTTGNFTTLGTSPGLDGMGFAPNGTMYAADFLSGVDQVDPLSGNLTPLGTVSNSINGSTVGSDGLIYAVSQDSSAMFFTIDPTTTALTVHVISSGLGFANDGLAVFANGIFYTDGIISGVDTLEAVDPVTGVATQIGTGFGLNSSSVAIQIFAGANVNGIIYGGGPVTDGNLYTINLSTGLATFDVATNGGDGLFALASVPEPSTAMLAGAGIALIGLVLTVRRRRPKGLHQK